MLVELRVSQLGVIEDLALLLGPGMTVLTGETGAGKTMLVDAIKLLTGGQSDPSLIRPGAEEALVEGRFVRPTGPEPASPGHTEPTEPAAPADELILTRVVPSNRSATRSRAYADGRMVSLGQLSEMGAGLVDLHGQHAHQSLLSPAAQRAGLDRAAGIDTSEVTAWRRSVRELRDARDALGGDQRSRARELDLSKYQLAEIDAAGLEDPGEDEALQAEEELLSDATGLAESARSAWEALSGEGGAADGLGGAIAAVRSRPALTDLHDRLVHLQEELADSAADARSMAERVQDDPERLARIGERRRVLTELRRKYGGTLQEVIAYQGELRAQVDELENHDARAAEVDAELQRAEKELAAAAERLCDARRKAAPGFSAAVEAELRQLAMPRARFSVEVGADPAEESVTWLLGANPGGPMLPLAKVASGGELSRTMLAVRLVMGRLVMGRLVMGRPVVGRPVVGSGSPQLTLVFDEVDAGIGGEAALAVGSALASLAPEHQVLVVTHLAQVAAFADHHLTVTKEAHDDNTVARVQAVEGDERVVELARMLSGRPDSRSARLHAEELLANSGAAPQPTTGKPAAGQREREQRRPKVTRSKRDSG